MVTAYTPLSHSHSASPLDSVALKRMPSAIKASHEPHRNSSLTSSDPTAMTRETNSHEPDEASPLLSAQHGILHPRTDPTAVPWAHLMPLIFLRMINGMAYSLIFPFVTELVTNLPDVPADKIGLYVGVAEGCLMITEAAAGVVWARLADRYGRRPCLVFGTLVTSVAGGLVGFSRGIWHVFLLRGARTSLQLVQSGCANGKWDSVHVPR